MTTNESDCNNPAKIDYQEHWNTAYTKNTTEKLGWFEESSKETLGLIKKTALNKKAEILVGVGSSMLIDELLAEGYTSLIASDLSEKALNGLEKRLAENASKVTFIADDIINYDKLQSLNNVNLWLDRAVFALNGAEKCCGLELQRYNTAKLQDKLGEEFKLIDKFNYGFINPYRSERPYIYTLFQRKNK